MDNTDIANEAIRRGKTPKEEAEHQLTFMEQLLKLQSIKLRKKELEEIEKALTTEVLLMQEALELDPNKFRDVLTYVERDNGYSDDLVSLLKAENKRDAIKIKETVDNAVVNEMVALGELDEDVVKRFKKEKTKFYSLPRSKGD